MHGTERKDIDGDGAEDVTFWYCRWKMGMSATTFMTIAQNFYNGSVGEFAVFIRNSNSRFASVGVADPLTVGTVIAVPWHEKRVTDKTFADAGGVR